MKKLAVVLMVVGLFAAVPVMAADHAGMKMETSDGMRDCALQAESIQQKISRIQGDLNEGSKKYSSKELENLRAKLKEANATLENIDKQ